MNLEQRRASNAIDKAPLCRKRGDEGDCLSGYPSLIVNNGLLACLAFAIDKSTKKDGSIDREKQWINIANAIAYHLHEMGICPRPAGNEHAIWLRDFLSGRARNAQGGFIAVNSFTLRRATDETLAFLSFLKRYAKQK